MMSIYRVTWEDSSGTRQHAEMRASLPEQAAFQLGQLSAIRNPATHAKLITVADAGPAGPCYACGVAADAACMPWCVRQLPENVW